MLIGTARLKTKESTGEITMFTDKYVVERVLFEGEQPNEFQVYTKSERDGEQIFDLISQLVLPNVIRTARPLYIGLDKPLKEDTQVFILGEDLSCG